jgi:quinolinate synthase
VIDLADEVKSTSGMLEYIKKTESREFIIGTETGIIHTLEIQNPDKVFVPADKKMICPDMKKIYLDDIVKALVTSSPVVKVEEGIRVRAYRAVERMLKIPRD